MDTKTVTNIIKLMEAGKAIGVESVTVGELNIIFDSSAKTTQNETAQHEDIPAFVANQYEETPQESYINEEIDINELEDEVRMLTDPQLFERELLGENQETHNIGSVTTL